MPTPPIIYPKESFRPKTNAERQAAFRARNPGYNRRYKRSRRALRAALLAQHVTAEAAAALPAPAAAPAVPQRLMLPAPVVLPILPGINTIRPRSDAVPQAIPRAA